MFNRFLYDDDLRSLGKMYLKTQKLVDSVLYFDQESRIEQYRSYFDGWRKMVYYFGDDGKLQKELFFIKKDSLPGKTYFFEQDGKTISAVVLHKERDGDNSSDMSIMSHFGKDITVYKSPGESMQVWEDSLIRSGDSFILYRNELDNQKGVRKIFYFDTNNLLTGVQYTGTASYKYFFKYLFDARGNWVEKRMYSEGQGGASKIVTLEKRVIEYY